MMRCYQEITILPDADVDSNFLWQKLFKQIHIGLAENKNADGSSSIGVSFPEYDAAEFSLGTKLRLFAEDEGALEKLKCEEWLSRLRDYVHIGSIKAVPDAVAGHACFCQVKPKGSRENLARRRAKRTGESYQQARAHFDGYREERSRLPYINMQSETNGHRFRLFIEKQIAEQAQAGTFNCYGLSGRDPKMQVTVPWF